MDYRRDHRKIKNQAESQMPRSQVRSPQFLAFFSRFINFYLQGRVREKETQRVLPFAGSMLKRPQHPVLSWSKTGSQEILPSLPCGCRDPRTWIILCCFPEYMSRELDGKQSGQNKKWCLSEMPALQANN